jgi:23S rRNA pseudouridine2605 synthase
MMRLQKALAAAGVDSRRKCEELILAGRVTVDGEVAAELGTQVNPQTQDIRLDGERVKPKRHVYYAVNKPKGVVTTNYDQEGRQRVVDLVPGGDSLFAVGRLDRESQGLIIVTNDGDLAQRLAHPSHEVAKTYHVEVVGVVERETLDTIRAGTHLAEAWVQPESVRVKRRNKRSTLLEMVLKEGRNREIRRLLARVGHKVVQLTRVAHGTLKLGDMPPGAHRPLTKTEIDRLWTRQAPRGTPEPDDRRAKQRPARSGGDDKRRTPGRKPARGPSSPAGKPARGRPAKPTGSSPRKVYGGDETSHTEDFPPRQPHEPKKTIRRKPRKPLGSTVRKKRGDDKKT